MNYRYDLNGTLVAVSRSHLTDGSSSILFAQTNTRGDVVSLYNSSGVVKVNYVYDSWGKLLSATDGNGNALAENSVGALNAIRYRGYVYDSETGFYYLQSRYYDATVGRFINSDAPSLITSSLNAVVNKNLFAYCDNNPVVREDVSGAIWESAWDAVSLTVSVIDVAANPTDPWVWVGLVGDAVDLALPFVGGLGEATKITKTVTKSFDKADETVDLLKTVSKADNTADIVKSTQKTTKKTHGNSLKSTKTNYGYVLVDTRYENKLLKFGETQYPTKRYSKKYLDNNGYEMKVLVEGNKSDIHFWQYDMNMYYKDKYGKFPPLNKRGW